MSMVTVTGRTAATRSAIAACWAAAEEKAHVAAEAAANAAQAAADAALLDFVDPTQSATAWRQAQNAAGLASQAASHAQNVQIIADNAKVRANGEH